jgi:PAS domain S-box-containing protein
MMKEKENKRPRETFMKGFIKSVEGPSADVRSLEHELGVHQEELKSQNEELRRAQLELARAHDRYKELFDFAPVGYLILDGSFMIREANLKAASLLGTPHKHLIGAPLSKFMDRGEADAYYLHLRQVQKSGIQQNRELVFRRPEGSLFHGHLVSSPREDNLFGNGLKIALFDITEQKQAAQALEERLRFERLLSHVSARFVNISPEQVDGEIESALKMLLDFFQVERCGLLRTTRDRTAWQITHVATADDQVLFRLESNCPARSIRGHTKRS